MNSLIVCLISVISIYVVNAVPVTIYYEALCSDSVHFITRQLYPNYQYFKDYVTIDFIPYGKSLHFYNATNGKYSFICHHGKEECKGNKFHACALAQIDNKDTQLEFIVCIMSTKNPANIYYIERCSQKYNLDFKKLTTCMVSSEGDKLLASHGDKTWKLEPNIYFVPTVVFNNSVMIDANDQNKSMVDFKDIVCKKISVHKLKICEHSGFFDRIKNYFSSR
ncbi:GILT-like protein 1 isoform X1 [Euwallacea fornicatus]|uniref:GILT-like protein 1 isoform X1 n=1 Tax=Euwallacea fornicatus TaxID=995702 RepID=UPI00338EB8A4